MKTVERKPRPPKYCPTCRASNWIPIVYGLPDFELFESASRGEVAIGGCVIFDDNPTWRCTACGQEWPVATDSHTAEWIAT